MQEDRSFDTYNPTLFQTKAWQAAWSAAWSKQLADLVKLGEVGSLQGYLDAFYIKGRLPISRATSLGCPSRTVDSIRSEYFQFPDINKSGLADFLSEMKHEAHFSDVVKGSSSHLHIQAVCDQAGLTLIEKGSSLAYSVDTSGEWSPYAKELGSNTRLKLVNRRKRLSEHGDIKLVNLFPDADAFVEQLNHFHKARWGKPCYSGAYLDFINQLLPALQHEGHLVDLSALTVNDEVQSLLLDIQVGSRVYNLQGGFYEDKYKGVSLGTLHFGYQIEKAFSDPNVIAYDFMAGEGKNANYKEKLANQSCQLIQLIAVKPLWLKLLYRLGRS